MTLAEIRNEIDTIDPGIKALFLRRMAVARQVARVKYESGDEIYKPDREREIIARLTADVAPELKAEYTAFLLKIMEVARKYEYGMIYDWDPSVLHPLLSQVDINDKDRYVTIRMTRPDRCSSMSQVLSMIGDHGFNMKQMTLLRENVREGTVEFELVICGNLGDTSMRKLVYQLWKEALALEIVGSCEDVVL